MGIAILVKIFVIRLLLPYHVTILTQRCGGGSFYENNLISSCV